VHYVYADGWLHGRTAPGAKLAVLRHHPWVAFEVDEIDGLFDWRSVVVHGVVDLPDADGSPQEREAHERTLAHVRELVPEALTAGDPAPHRFLAFRIHVDDATGRAADAGS
jgi:nitroimidazol reductase NimA-like FMN-containing flavoprotein (pyridoxamine 5'-phosphate oxidase superfamily)